MAAYRAVLRAPCAIYWDIARQTDTLGAQARGVSLRR
jgi:hypothetical protein